MPSGMCRAQPEWMLAEELTDNLPVTVEWPRMCALLLDRRPVPRVVAEDAAMKNVLEKLRTSARLETAPTCAGPVTHWRMHKRLLREACS